MTYHFIITMVFGPRQVTIDGAYKVQPGMTRKQVFGEIVEIAKRKAASAELPTDEFGILFFSFEPNELAA